MSNESTSEPTSATAAKDAASSSNDICKLRKEIEGNEGEGKGSGDDIDVSKSFRDRHRKRLSEWWIGMSYLFYGVELSVFAFTLIYLRELGTREFAVGVFSATTDIPVLFRVGVGILTDSYDFRGLGHRRPAVCVGLALSSAAFLLIALLVVGGGFRFWTFVLFYFISAMGKELSQGTLDAYANEITRREHAGRMQGIVIGASRVVGLFLGLGIGAYATSGVGDPGYVLMFMFTAIVALIPTVLTFWTKEPLVHSVFNWRQPIKAFRKPNMFSLGVFIAVGGFLLSSNTLAFSGYLQGNDVVGIQLASYFIVFYIFFLVGSIVAATTFDRYRQKLPLVFTFVMVMTIFAELIFIAAEQFDTPELLYLFIVLLATFGASLIVMGYSLAMVLIEDRNGSGSIFAVLHVFQAAGSVSAGLATGAILEVSSYSVNCSLSIVALLVGIPIAYFASRNLPAHAAESIENCENSEINAETSKNGESSTEIVEKSNDKDVIATPTLIDGKDDEEITVSNDEDDEEATCSNDEDDKEATSGDDKDDEEATPSNGEDAKEATSGDEKDGEEATPSNGENDKEATSGDEKDGDEATSSDSEHDEEKPVYVDKDDGVEHIELTTANCEKTRDDKDVVAPSSTGEDDEE